MDRALGELEKKFPRFVPVTAPATSWPAVAAPERAIRHATVWLADTCPLLSRGGRVAVTAGSRAFTGFVPVLRQLVGLLRARGLQPFLIPAMGSHGGGTPAGQLEVLAKGGVTPSTVGAPIICAVPSVEAGRPVALHSPRGNRLARVFCHPAALAADALLVVNRVQSHTAFEGEVQSGLLKMLAVGVGGPEGASETHALGAVGLQASILEMSRALAHRLPVAGALATVEDSRKDLVAVDVAGPGWVALRKTDARCLALAREIEPRLPVDDLDLLLVDWMGKDICGSGMHPTVVGRLRVWDYPDPDRPRVRRVVVFRLTPGSAGNANGIGLADFTTRRLAEAIDWPKTLKNVLTSTFTKRALLPPVFPTDREAVRAALLTLGPVDPRRIRAMRLTSTGQLGRYWVSDGLLRDVLARGARLDGEPSDLPFGADGNLRDLH